MAEAGDIGELLKGENPRKVMVYREATPSSSEIKFIVNKEYVLGRWSNDPRLEQEIQQNGLSAILLKTQEKDGLQNFSRQHLVFHLEKERNQLFFVIDDIPAKNGQVTYYYRGINIVGRDVLDEAYEPKSAVAGKRYPVTNLTLLTEASRDFVLRILFTGESIDSVIVEPSLTSAKKELDFFDLVPARAPVAVPV